MYKTSKSGKMHTASAPGEPPAIDTGNLVNSIRTDRSGVGEAVVGTNVEYATHLEYGTGKMAARPFMRPAVDEHKDEIIKVVRDFVASAIKGML